MLAINTRDYFYCFENHKKPYFVWNKWFLFLITSKFQIFNFYSIFNWWCLFVFVERPDWCLSSWNDEYRLVWWISFQWIGYYHKKVNWPFILFFLFEKQLNFFTTTKQTKNKKETKWIEIILFSNNDCLLMQLVWMRQKHLSLQVHPLQTSAAQIFVNLSDKWFSVNHSVSCQSPSPSENACFWQHCGVVNNLQFLPLFLLLCCILSCLWKTIPTVATIVPSAIAVPSNNLCSCRDDTSTVSSLPSLHFSSPVVNFLLIFCFFF